MRRLYREEGDDAPVLDEEPTLLDQPAVTPTASCGHTDQQHEVLRGNRHPCMADPLLAVTPTDTSEPRTEERALWESGVAALMSALQASGVDPEQVESLARDTALHLGRARWGLVREEEAEVALRWRAEAAASRPAALDEPAIRRDERKKVVAEIRRRLDKQGVIEFSEGDGLDVDDTYATIDAALSADATGAEGGDES